LTGAKDIGYKEENYYSGCSPSGINKKVLKPPEALSKGKGVKFRRRKR